MNKIDAKNRIAKLKTEIDIGRYNYHVLDKETISPAALDSLKNELFQLEQEFPDLITPDSPTQRIGGQPLNKFVKVTHSQPMLSLFDAFSEADISDWEARNLKYALAQGIALPKLEYYCELKLDGLAITLKYQDGVLIQAATRGDGKIGEDVTQNVKTIESIPLNIKQMGMVEVRGEAIMFISTLKKLNIEYQARKQNLLANTRNAAAGSIRQLDSKVTASRKLQFFAYDILLPEETREKADKLCAHLGFKTVKDNKLCSSLEEVFAFHHYWEKNKTKLDYNIDGVVIKINQLDLWPKLGIVGKAPRYAMAYKFSAEQVTTKVLTVVWQVGRTGILTPIVVLEPVKVGGAIVARATLHNFDEINRLDLRQGDTIILERAGDVIPKVVSVLPKLRNGSEKKINLPKTCPMCGEAVIKIPGEVAYRCSAKKCFAVALRQLEHFVSKNALDIDGLGPKIIEQLMSVGLIKDAADIYYLKKIDLENLDRFAAKSADNLLQAISERKEIPLGKFLFALGIRHIGEESALTLAKEFKVKKGESVDVIEVKDFFATWSEDKYLNLTDFGPIVAKSLREFWADDHIKELFAKLDKAGVTVILPKKKLVVGQKDLSNQTFVLTGTLSRLTRDSAKAKIRELGGKVSGSVSAQTSFVVVGDEPGSKYDEAKKLGVKTLKEEEFLKLIS